MEDHRTPFLFWVNELLTLGAADEEEQLLRVTAPLPGLDLQRITGVLNHAVFGDACTAYIRLPDKAVDPCSYGVDDFILAPPGVPLCEEHASAYAALYERQESERRIDPGMRYVLLKGISGCARCAAPFELKVTLGKKKALGRLVAERGHTLPESVLSRLWLSETAMNRYYTLPAMLQWPERGVLLVTRWPLELGCDFIRTASLSAESFWEQLLTGAAALAGQHDLLSDLTRGRPAGLPEGVTLLPAAYWVSRKTLREGRFAPALAAGLHARELLALGLLRYVATRVEAGLGKGGIVERLTFTLERDQRLELEVAIGTDHLRVGTETLDLTRLEGDLLTFYEKAMAGARLRSNQAMVQSAVITMGGDSLLSVLKAAPRILTYYEFQQQSLMEERFRQHAEISHTYLVRRQEAGAKVAAAVSDLYKTLAAIATAIGGLAIVVLTTMIKDPTNGNYLVYTGLALALVYVPAYLIWADQVVEDTLDRISDFREQMKWSVALLKFPEEKLQLPEVVGELRQRVFTRARGVLFLLGVMFAGSMAALWYGYFSMSNTLRNKVGPTWFRLLFLAWLAAVVIGVARRWQQRKRALR